MLATDYGDRLSFCPVLFSHQEMFRRGTNLAWVIGLAEGLVTVFRRSAKPQFSRPLSVPWGTRYASQDWRLQA